MSGSSTVTHVLGASTTVAGVSTLPNTGDNIVGQILAASAIVIGLVAIVSQVVVRAVRAKS